MLNYSWSDDYSVGNSLLDSHHQALLNMFNDISSQLGQESSVVALLKLIADLKDYTVYHFEAEERLMKAADYPDLKTHMEMHNSFIDQVQQSMDKISNNPDAATEDLFIFLSSWLINHIQKVDMAYKDKI